jgi:hypothetical protein
VQHLHHPPYILHHALLQCKCAYLALRIISHAPRHYVRDTPPAHTLPTQHTIPIQSTAPTKIHTLYIPFTYPTHTAYIPFTTALLPLIYRLSTAYTRNTTHHIAPFYDHLLCRKMYIVRRYANVWLCCAILWHPHPRSHLVFYHKVVALQVFCRFLVDLQVYG